MVQQVKDPALSLQQPGWLPWCGVNSWPGNFHMPQTQPKKKKKEKKEEEKERRKEIVGPELVARTRLGNLYPQVTDSLSKPLLV